MQKRLVNVSADQQVGKIVVRFQKNHWLTTRPSNHLIQWKLDSAVGSPLLPRSQGFMWRGFEMSCWIWQLYTMPPCYLQCKGTSKQAHHQHRIVWLLWFWFRVWSGQNSTLGVLFRTEATSMKHPSRPCWTCSLAILALSKRACTWPAPTKDPHRNNDISLMIFSERQGRPAQGMIRVR